MKTSNDWKLVDSLLARLTLIQQCGLEETKRFARCVYIIALTDTQYRKSNKSNSLMFLFDLRWKSLLSWFQNTMQFFSLYALLSTETAAVTAFNTTCKFRFSCFLYLFINLIFYLNKSDIDIIRCAVLALYSSNYCCYL